MATDWTLRCVLFNGLMADWSCRADCVRYRASNAYMTTSQQITSMTEQREASGAAMGAVRIVLRLEGLAVLGATLIAFGYRGSGWGWFALFFLAPDLSFLGYLAGSRIGAFTYNAAHSYIGPVACLITGSLLAMPAIVTAGIIWCAHIGFDRTLGYGLKYASGFGQTHLGRIGRAEQSV